MLKKPLLEARVSIRFTKYEKAELEKKAKEYKLKLAEFVRLKMLATRDTAIAPIVKVDLEQYDLLGKTSWKVVRMGNNINQLAHNANLSINMGVPMQLQLESLTEIKDLISEVVSDISKLRLEIKELGMVNHDL